MNHSMIFWIVLSLTLVWELRGEMINGRDYEYPTNQIQYFAEENKALMKRMYIPLPEQEKLKEAHSEPMPTARRQLLNPNRVDSCDSKAESISPNWAPNFEGKMRAIVNTDMFQQSVYQETCVGATSARCSNSCGCEQKYRWHRLLAYDPEDDCKGVFLDWFIYPSCCVCRCDS